MMDGEYLGVKSLAQQVKAFHQKTTWPKQGCPHGWRVAGIHIPSPASESHPSGCDPGELVCKQNCTCPSRTSQTAVCLVMRCNKHIAEHITLPEGELGHMYMYMQNFMMILFQGSTIWNAHVHGLAGELLNHMHPPHVPSSTSSKQTLCNQNA